MLTTIEMHIEGKVCNREHQMSRTAPNCVKEFKEIVVQKYNLSTKRYWNVFQNRCLSITTFIL